MKQLLAVTAVLAVGAYCLSFAAFFRSPSSAGVTSCAQIAHDYVVQVAKANGLRIDSYKLLACHQANANHSVARARVVVSPVGFPKGVLVQAVTLVYHLTKSPWVIADVHPAG